MIDREHSGQEGTNEYGDPWKFIQHDRDDDRGGVVRREYCPGSGKNVASARDGY